LDFNNSHDESDSLSKRELDKAKNELIFVSNLLFKNGLLTTTGGNISSRVGNKVVITPSGASNALLWQVTPKDLVVLDLEGRVLDGGNPSIETPVHIALYSKIPEVNAIIHAHTSLLSAFAKLGMAITENMFIREATLRNIPLVPIAKPGRELAEIVCQALKNVEFDTKFGKLYLLESHGVLSIGKNLRQAYSTLDLGNQMALRKILEKLLEKK
jgi:L-fuculose-phosphate aldolase